MATYYVYAPVSGSNWGQSTYCCCGGTHPTVWCIGGSQPIDIGTGSIVPVYFWASGNVASIRVSHCNGVCISQAHPWTEGVKVEMYTGSNATGTKIGTVGYGHVTSRTGTGVFNVSMRQLGYLPYNCTTQCGGCSSGIHVHMQGNGTAYSFSCYQSLSVGSTRVYRWVI